MLAWSRYTALLYAIGLAIGEAAINWGHWQWWPLWVVDYAIVVGLLTAFWRTREGRNALELATAWAFACGVFYMALFVSLNLIKEGTRELAGKEIYLGLIAVMLCFSIAGVATALLSTRRS